MKILFFVAAGALALYGLHRLALWMESRGWLYYLNKQPTTSALSSAFLEVQSIIDPAKRTVIEAMREEDAEQSEVGAPPEPGRKEEERNGK